MGCVLSSKLDGVVKDGILRGAVDVKAYVVYLVDDD